MGKESFYAQINRPLALAYESAGEAMACHLMLDDAREGMEAFLGKRPPVWTGR